MNDEKKGNGNTVLLTVIGVATLLVALVGATFAYFSATITNNAKESVIITTAAPIGLEYLGETLSLPNAVPGDTKDGTFTVENPSTSKVSQTYDLDLIVDANGFSTAYQANNGRAQESGDAALLAEQLVLTISGESNGTNTPSVLKSGKFNMTNGTTPLTDEQGKIVDDQLIAPGEKHTYSINVNFKELNIPQDANQGQSFQAHIEISDPTSVTPTEP